MLIKLMSKRKLQVHTDSIFQNPNFLLAQPFTFKHYGQQITANYSIGGSSVHVNRRMHFVIDLSLNYKLLC